jgi:alpha-tubulin suppressor-like RCC1 family protein
MVIRQHRKHVLKYIDVKKYFHLQARGVGVFGALGTGRFDDEMDFVTVASNIASISSGIGHSAAITNDGELMIFGRPYDFYSALRLNRFYLASPRLARFVSKFSYRLQQSQQTPEILLTPTGISDLKNHQISKVSCSGGLTAALTNNGKVFCIGMNKFGQIGIGEETLFRVWKPTLSVGIPKTINVDTGLQHCIALTEYGDVFTWGKGNNGQIGDGSCEASTFPKLIKSTKSFVDIAAGLNHSAAVSSDGVVYVWGRYMSSDLVDGKQRTRKGNTVIPYIYSHTRHDLFCNHRSSFTSSSLSSRK